MSPCALPSPGAQLLSGPSDPLLVRRGRGGGRVSGPRGPRRRPACPGPPVPAHTATPRPSASLQFSTSLGFPVRCPCEQPRFPGEPSAGREGGRPGPSRGGRSEEGPFLCLCKCLLVRAARRQGAGHLWGGVLGLTPAPRSLEDDRPAGTRSGPPPGGLLLAQPCPLPGVPVSPREDVAARVPPSAPGHAHPCGELGAVGTVLGTWGGAVLTPSLPHSPQASPGGDGAGRAGSRAPQGRRGAWSAPPLPVTYPSPTQGDPTEDPAVAFVDIPGDQACAPGTCIQVGGAVLPTSSTPRPQGGPGLPRGPLQPRSPSSRCLWGMRAGAGSSCRLC